MAGKPIGTIYAELDLDTSKYTAAQKKILYDSQTYAINVENSWKVLGQKSDVMYEAMRKQATNAYENIKSRATSSSAEIVRAEEAKNARLKSLNEQQFGHQTSLIDSIKKHYIAASVAIVAAWALVNRAVAYMDEAGKALQVESSFKIMADAAEVNSEYLIASMKKATKETIDDSDLMQKAVKLMTLGYNPDQIVRFSKVVITASQIAGTTAAEAYEQLSDAIANRMPKALVRMGAVTREQMKVVNEAIAKGADEMTLYELAMANLELKQKMLQGTQNQATIALQKFHAEMKEFRENIGKGLIVVLEVAYRGFQYLAAGVLGLVSAYAQYRTLVYEIIGDEKKAAANREVANAAWAARNELVRQVEQAISGESETEGKATKQEIAGAKAKVDSQMAVLKGMDDKKKKDISALNAMDALKKKYEELGIEMEKLQDPAHAGERALKLFFDEIVKASKSPATTEMKEWFAMIIARFHDLEAEKGWKKTVDDMVKAQDELADKTSDLALELLKLKDPIRADEISFNNLKAKILEGIPIYGNTEKAVIALTQKYNDLRDEQGKMAIKSAEAARTEMENFQQTQTALALLDSAYASGMLTIEQYYSQKRKIVYDSTMTSIDALQTEKLEIDKWMESKKKTAALMEIETRIRALQLEAQREGIKLNFEETKSLEQFTKEKADWVGKLAEVKGDWGGIYASQIQSLQATKDMTLATAGLDEETKKVIADYYDLQIAEAKAKKDMDAFGLSVIGMRKYFMQTKNELSNAFENVLPNAMKSFWDEFEGYLKTGEMNWESFADSLKNIWANLMRKMLESFVNDFLSELLNLGKSSSGGIFSWISKLFGGGGEGTTYQSYEWFGEQYGGLITGPSGVDQVPIRATAGEFMQPVSAVNYYGHAFMEAIRNKKIPKFYDDIGKNEILSTINQERPNQSISVGPIEIHMEKSQGLNPAILKKDIENAVIDVIKRHM